MKRTAVFDLDGTLETPYLGKDDVESVRKAVSGRFGADVFAKMYAETLGGMPHFFLNGALELLKWVDSRGMDIVFFSNAIRPRNEELCPILMARAFGGGKPPHFRLFSRPDCLDQNHGVPGFHRDDFDGLWGGGYKKKLAGVVVPEGDVGETLMLEDDSSYACMGEERNFIYGMYGGNANEFLANWSRGDKGWEKIVPFHLPFWFCGILSRTLKIADTEGLALADAALRAMYGDDWPRFPADGRYPEGKTWEERHNIPQPPQKDFSVFKEGLRELRAVNPSLCFWGDIDETSEDWPEWVRSRFW